MCCLKSLGGRVGCGEGATFISAPIRGLSSLSFHWRFKEKSRQLRTFENNPPTLHSTNEETEAPEVRSMRRMHLRQAELNLLLPTLRTVPCAQYSGLVFLSDPVRGWARWLWLCLSLQTTARCPPHPPLEAGCRPLSHDEPCSLTDWPALLSSVLAQTLGHQRIPGMLAQATVAFIGTIKQPPSMPKLCADQKKQSSF